MKHVQYTEAVPQSSHHPILLDIMFDGRFLCQLRYTRRGFPQMIDGRAVECHDARDIEAFVLDKRQSLRGRNYSILPSRQQVFTNIYKR